jgi:hypothetical protein
MYETNSEVHRHKRYLQTPVASVTVVQEGVHCDGVKLGNKIQCLTINALNAELNPICWHY